MSSLPTSEEREPIINVFSRNIQLSRSKAMIPTQKSYFQICCSFYSTGCSLLMMTSKKKKKKRSKYTADEKCKNKFNISICVCVLKKNFPVKIRKDNTAKKQALPGNHLTFSSHTTWDFCFFSVSCNMFIYFKDGFLFHFIFHFNYYN